MARVGSLLQVHPTSATSAVARLEAQGWVVRSRSAADGRVVLATVTQEGRDVADRATEGLNREVFSRPGLPLEQVERLTALLEEHRRAAGDL
jgi:DNA-binding MarR family transcriptional regulator